MATIGSDLAFPVYESDPVHPGLTKREHIAVELCKGMLAANGQTSKAPAEALSDIAVMFADTLIARLNQ